MGQLRQFKLPDVGEGLTDGEIAALHARSEGNPLFIVEAERLGVTQQTVSRAVKTSGWREESAAHPLAVRLLSMIDLTSTR